MIRVESIMSMEVISVSCTATVAEAEICLADASLTGAPLLDASGKLFGVISIRDILEHRVSASSSDADSAGSIGTEGAITIEIDANIHSATKLMASKRVRRLVVVDGEAIVGMLSATDLVAMIAGLDPTEVDSWTIDEDRRP